MEPRDLTLSQASALIQARKLSLVELLQSQLAQVRRLEPTIKAWVTFDQEAALLSARQAEDELRQRGPRSPLHGIHIGLKDIFYTKGIRTTACSPLYETFVPDYDATCVARLKAVGAIIAGKAVTTQFAAGDPSPTRNPWNLEHTPGGSSSGSGAAVASRMCQAALGSQTGGSTLRPAAYNGVVGLKPTYGRISRYGVIPLAWSLDTVGILCRSVEDAALLLQVMAGHDPHDPSSSHASVGDYVSAATNVSSPPYVGVIREFYFDNATPEVRAHTNGIADALGKAGAKIEEVKLPPGFYAHETARSVVTSVETAAFHYEAFKRNPGAYGPSLARSIRSGSLTSGVDYLQAQRLRRQFRNAMESLLVGYDALLTPSTPSSAPRDLNTTGNPLFQSAWTSCGVPAISIPSGLDKNGMPFGVQLVGAPFSEARLLGVARWCETILDLNLRPPGC